MGAILPLPMDLLSNFGMQIRPVELAAVGVSIAVFNQVSKTMDCYQGLWIGKCSFAWKVAGHALYSLYFIRQKEFIIPCCKWLLFLCLYVVLKFYDFFYRLCDVL